MYYPFQGVFQAHPGGEEYYPEGSEYDEVTGDHEETGDPEGIYYEEDTIPLKNVVDPSGSVPLTYYADDQDDDLSDDNA